MKLHYELKCIDEDNGEVVAQISSFSEEGLMEESGKRKWTDTIKSYEHEQLTNERDGEPEQGRHAEEFPYLSARAYRSVKPDGDEETRQGI